MKLPNTAEELITLLEEIIPEPTPKPGQSEKAIMYDAGRRSVVLQLRDMRHGSTPKVLRQARGEGRIVPSKNP